jgi:hypothetical protein
LNKIFVFEQVTIKYKQQYVLQLHIIVRRDLQEFFIGDEYSLEAGIFLVRLIASKLLQFKNILHFDILWLFLFL